MDKIKTGLMILVIFAVLLIAGSITYYYVFYLPGNAKAMQDKATEESITEKNALNNCLLMASIVHDQALKTAWENYNEAWKGECKRLNLTENSALPNIIADRLNQRHKDEIDRADKQYESAKNDCYKLYGK